MACSSALCFPSKTMCAADDTGAFFSCAFSDRSFSGTIFLLDTIVLVSIFVILGAGGLIPVILAGLALISAQIS